MKHLTQAELDAAIAWTMAQPIKAFVPRLTLEEAHKISVETAMRSNENEYWSSAEMTELLNWKDKSPNGLLKFAQSRKRTVKAVYNRLHCIK